MGRTENFHLPCCRNVIPPDATVSLVLPWLPLGWQGEVNPHNTELPWSAEHSTAQHSSTGAHHKCGAVAPRHRIRKPFLFLSKTIKCLWEMHREKAGLGLLISPQCKEQAVNSFRRGEIVSSDSCVYSSCTGLHQSQAILTTLFARWLFEVRCFIPRCRHKRIQ